MSNISIGPEELITTEVLSAIISNHSNLYPGVAFDIDHVTDQAVRITKVVRQKIMEQLGLIAIESEDGNTATISPEHFENIKDLVSRGKVDEAITFIRDLTGATEKIANEFIRTNFSDE